MTTSNKTFRRSDQIRSESDRSLIGARDSARDQIVRLTRRVVTTRARYLSCSLIGVNDDATRIQVQVMNLRATRAFRIVLYCFISEKVDLPMSGLMVDDATAATIIINRIKYPASLAHYSAGI